MATVLYAMVALSNAHVNGVTLTETALLTCLCPVPEKLVCVSQGSGARFPTPVVLSGRTAVHLSSALVSAETETTKYTTRGITRN